MEDLVVAEAGGARVGAPARVDDGARGVGRPPSASRASAPAPVRSVICGIATTENQPSATQAAAVSHLGASIQTIVKTIPARAPPHTPRSTMSPSGSSSTSTANGVGARDQHEDHRVVEPPQPSPHGRPPSNPVVERAGAEQSGERNRVHGRRRGGPPGRRPRHQGDPRHQCNEERPLVDDAAETRSDRWRGARGRNQPVGGGKRLAHPSRSRRSRPRGAWTFSIRTGSAVRLENVRHAGRHEHERAGGRRKLALLAVNRELTVEDVERVVLPSCECISGPSRCGWSVMIERLKRGVLTAGEELDVPDALALAGEDHPYPGLAHRSEL